MQESFLSDFFEQVCLFINYFAMFLKKIQFFVTKYVRNDIFALRTSSITFKILMNH